MPDAEQQFDFEVRRAPLHTRLDAYLAARFKTRSRAFFQKLIKDGRVSVNGASAKRHHEVKVGDRIRLTMDLAPRPTKVRPEELPLDILYEDETMIVVNKAPGVVLHPAKGHRSGTLINAVLHHCQSPASVGGPSTAGVIHRLDRDTSGVVVFAKNPEAHPAIAIQFERRQVSKAYQAIVEGEPKADEGTIDLPLGPHVFQRFKVTVRPDIGRESVTDYRVLERFDGFALLELNPRTGRGHQIRVHAAAAGLPILCDRIYGTRNALYRGDLTDDPLAQGGEPVLTRQALHAHRLTLRHPVSGKRLTLVAPLAPDMTQALKALRELRPRKAERL